MRNELTNVTLTFPVDTSQVDMITSLSATLEQYDKIYSYIVYREVDKQGALTGHKIVIVTSKTEAYNAINAEDAIADIVMCTIVPRDNPHRAENIAGYEQPPLEILVEAYKPLIHKLALQQHQYWQKLEVNDLVQMCTCQLIILYRRGYYVHKKLLSTSFNNMVLKSIRKDSHKTVLPLTAAACVSDDYDEDMDRKESQSILVKYKLQLVKDIVSPATLAQLICDYNNNCTSSWTQATIKRIRNDLRRRGYTYDRIIKEVFGE